MSPLLEHANALDRARDVWLAVVLVAAIGLLAAIGLAGVV